MAQTSLTGPHEAKQAADAAAPARALRRRDFLKISGFSLGGALIAGCQPAKVEKAIPFLIKPEEVTPGVSTWYASTCGGCAAGCGVMAKTRDGRPVKLEGVPSHPVSDGGLCAVGQAHLLALYDSHRLMEPVAAGAPTTWEALDDAVTKKLSAIREAGGPVRLLTGTVTSPTTKEAIRRFLAGFSDGRHIVYDAHSSSSILDAHERTHGARVLPRYRFDRARVIASFHANFLGTWISPVEFTAGYRKGRLLNGSGSRFSYHVQYESRLSITGSNADVRECQSPTEIRATIEQLASVLAQKAGRAIVHAAEPASPQAERLADRLWRARGESLVISAFNDLPTQLLINDINDLLGNYGATIDVEAPSYQKQGNDTALLQLIGELRAGTVSAMIIQGCNPVYDLPAGDEFAGLLRTVPLVVRCTDRLDETADAAAFVCPEPHALERWDDAEPVAGTVTLTQPVIRPFGKTRPFVENLQAWMGEERSALDAIRREWERSVYPRAVNADSFGRFWDGAVEHGFARVESPKIALRAFDRGAVVGRLPSAYAPPEGPNFDLMLYVSHAVLDGRHAHNPWLQELPDPITKIVWDNYVSLSPASAGRLGIEEGDVLRVSAGGRSLELPAHIQPGQHDFMAAISLGYGRKGTDRFTAIGPQWLQAQPTVDPGGLVGKNAAIFISTSGGSLLYDNARVTLAKTGRRSVLACTQEHQTLEVPEHLAAQGDERRPIVQETTLAAYLNDPAAGRRREGELVSLWSEDHAYAGHHWGMAVDLSACTGCSACVVSCMAENNIPVVGRDEVYRNRELAWIRIDRYYEEREGGGVTAIHQPMMCQHCGNAPCETVCPVLATVHSEEGLNQQVYNRCVGTRYCSNNCPYKVRRFNWFEYDHGDQMQRLVLNPDVTTRERGIMEKCSFCVQRIQEGKIEAKKKNIPVTDGSIRPACAQSCPAQAIVFGDMNDPRSAIAARMKDPRFYRVLEELGVKPSVGYLTLVRNSEEPRHG